MTKASAFLTATLLLVFATVSLWLCLERRKLSSENARLRAAAETNAANDVRSASQELDSGELQRLRTEHTELLRLRGEVSQLRQQLKEARLQTGKRANGEKAAQTAAVEDSPSPVEHYVANVQATVPWQHTLVTGGWKLASGKHALFFMEPNRMDAAGNDNYDPAMPGQISLQARIAEVPDEVLTRLGLDALKSETKEPQMLLNSEQAKVMVKALEETTGVDLLSAPKITTLDGRQAQIKIGQPSPDGIETGPSIDFTPVVSSGGAAVELRLSANLRVRKNQTLAK